MSSEEEIKNFVRLAVGETFHLVKPLDLSEVTTVFNVERSNNFGEAMLTEVMRQVLKDLGYLPQAITIKDLIDSATPGNTRLTIVELPYNNPELQKLIRIFLSRNPSQNDTSERIKTMRSVLALLRYIKNPEKRGLKKVVRCKNRIEQNSFK